MIARELLGVGRPLLVVTLASLLGFHFPPAARASDPIFLESAAEAGLDFVHFNGMKGDFYLLEVTGSGTALLDYDRDGDLDVYLVQGGELAGGRSDSELVFAPPPGTELTDRLYRNDLVVDSDGTARAVFTDVTREAGIRIEDYGMGAAAADYDGDGWTDLYITGFGPNHLLRNNGDGTFSDVTDESGTQDTRWSVPASFVDVDRDGKLDLYVGNYVQFHFSLDRQCKGPTGAPDYCGPLAYSPEGDSLFRNRGDGTFEDWSKRAGILAASGGALGTLATDFNGDGLDDIYVANDMTANQLWINQGDGTFVDEALFAGCAVNYEGKPEASMGVDAADFDGDGDEDLFVAHLNGESNTLYVNDGSGFFRDQTLISGLANPSWNFTAFGTAFFDYDNDGHLDLMAVNGAVKTIEALALAQDPLPLRQPNQLFRNLGNGKFEETTATAGQAFELADVSRGAGFGDVDNDGDADVVVANNAGPTRLLLNQRGNQNTWIGLDSSGTAGRGTEKLAATFHLEGGRSLTRRSRTDGSYASANDARIVAGLGPSGAADSVSVRWASGRESRWIGPRTGAYLVLFDPAPTTP